MHNINLLIILVFVVSSMVLTAALSSKKKWWALLISSLLLYYFLVGPKIIMLIMLAGIIYSAGLFIHQKLVNLWVILPILLMPLLIFKFTVTGNHFENYVDQELHIFDWTHWNNLFHILGLSYFTFNGISYLIDIKRAYVEPQRNFFKLLLYLTYFPTIFSGPLHRAKYIFKEFDKVSISNSSISKGARLILWGLFKNMVVAQRIYILMNEQIMNEISGPYYLVFGLLFFLYLYCNFSSFINLFQGVSEIFNVRLRNNFRPTTYLSSSRQEFWRGWHITLNEWFRDYFFYVIIKFDRKRKYTSLLLLITFLLIALWHQFTLTLIIWGLFNGLWIIIEKKVPFNNWPYPGMRKISGTFYHLILSSLLALIFISPEPLVLIQKLISKPIFLEASLLKSQLPNITIVLVVFLTMNYHSIKSGSQRFDSYIESKPTINRWVIYFKLTLLILAFGIDAGINNYYIQF